MKITVTKGEVIVHYEEPQKDASTPAINYCHTNLMTVIKLICEQVKELSK